MHDQQVIEEQLRAEWFDEVHRIIRRDTGRSPREWFDEMADGDDERAVAMHQSFVRALRVHRTQCKYAPATSAAWFITHLFREEELT